MKIIQFIQGFQEKHSCHHFLINPEEEIYTFKPFPQAEPFETNILYVGYLSDIKPEGCSFTLNFLCLTEGNDRIRAKGIQSLYPNANFLYLFDSLDLREIFDIVSNLFLIETRYINQIHLLVNAFNTNRGIQHLVDVAYQITHSPIIIMDISYRILAMYRDISADQEFDLKQQRELGYLSEHNLERMKRDNIYEKLRQSPDKTNYSRAFDAKYHWLDSLVYVHGVEVAEIGMIEYDHKFTRYDFEFMNFFKQLISWELQKENTRPLSKGMMHSIFLGELLEQKFASQEAIERRMRMLGWKKTKYYYVLTTFSIEQKEFFQSAEIFSIQLQNLLADGHWTITNQALIFLIFTDNKNIEEFLSPTALSRLLNRNRMYGILSNCFSNLSEIKKYYEQTLAIREFRNRFAPNDTICFYWNYTFFHIAKIVSETHNLKDFYHPVVSEIRDYDQKNHTYYLETLQEYLIYLGNPTLCSQNLHIHKNTFFYRINKIKELFSLNLESGRECMQLLLTIEFMQLEL